MAHRRGHRADQAGRASWHRRLRQHLGLIDRPSSWPLQRVIAEGADLSAFLRASGLQNHTALRAQADLLSDETGDLIVDRVLRFETLQADFDQLISDLGLPSTKLSVRNAAPVGVRKPVLSPDDRAFIARRHQRDFAAFGYDIDQSDAA